MNNFKHIPIHEFAGIYNDVYEFHKEGNDPLPALKEDSLSQINTCLITTSESYFGVEKYETLYEKAANLFYCLIKGHKLENGNKRIAIAATQYFFYINEEKIILSNEQFYKLAIKVSESDSNNSDQVKAYITSVFKNMHAHFADGGKIKTEKLKQEPMSKIENLKSEIKEYESILHEKGVPSDEKNAAMDEIKELKKILAEEEQDLAYKEAALKAKEAAIKNMRDEKKKKLRKQVGGAKIRKVRKKAKGQIGIKKEAGSTLKGINRTKKKKSSIQYPESKKKANMISIGANVKKFNKGRHKSDIVKDKQRKAKFPGKRISGDGNTYYEKRSNRADISKRERLEAGGRTDGYVNEDQFEKFMTNQINYVISLKYLGEKKKIIKNLIENMPDYVGSDMQKKITTSNLKYALQQNKISEINNVLKISLNALSTKSLEGGGSIYNKGGDLDAKVKAEAVQQAVNIVTVAYKNNIRASDLSFEEFSKQVFDVSGTAYHKADLQLAYKSMKETGYEKGGFLYAKGGAIDIGMGYLGNGLTIWDRNREKNGDYKIIAHINDQGEISYYDKNLPDYAKDIIKSEALVIKANKVSKGGSLYKKGGSVTKRTPIKQPSKFAKVMQEFKAGTLKSSSGDTVTDKKQALAIAFSESRKEKMQNA